MQVRVQEKYLGDLPAHWIVTLTVPLKPTPLPVLMTPIRHQPKGTAGRPTITCKRDREGRGFKSCRARSVCSNRAATRVNLLKTREKCVRRKTVFCRDFEISRNLQQTIALLSHGRGRWFDPSIAHSGKYRFAGKTQDVCRGWEQVSAFSAPVVHQRSSRERPPGRTLNNIPYSRVPTYSTITAWSACQQPLIHHLGLDRRGRNGPCSCAAEVRDPNPLGST